MQEVEASLECVYPLMLATIMTTNNTGTTCIGKYFGTNQMVMHEVLSSALEGYGIITKSNGSGEVPMYRTRY